MNNELFSLSDIKNQILIVQSVDWFSAYLDFCAHTHKKKCISSNIHQIPDSTSTVVPFAYRTCTADLHHFQAEANIRDMMEEYEMYTQDEPEEEEEYSEEVEGDSYWVTASSTLIWMFYRIAITDYWLYVLSCESIISPLRERFW